jgi:hypothetical protein
MRRRWRSGSIGWRPRRARRSRARRHWIRLRSRPPRAIEIMLRYFGSLEDPRIDRTKFHPLENIIVMTLCGAIAGADGWEALEAFAEARADWFVRVWRTASSVRPGNTGLQGREVRVPHGNAKCRPADAKSARSMPQPGGSVASLATARVTSSAMRRHANGWAAGMQPRNLYCPGVERFHDREDRSIATGPGHKVAMHPAGWSTAARTEEDGPGNLGGPCLSTSRSGEAEHRSQGSEVTRQRMHARSIRKKASASW